MPIRLRVSHPDYDTFDATEKSKLDGQPTLAELRNKNAAVVLHRRDDQADDENVDTDSSAPKDEGSDFLRQLDRAAAPHLEALQQHGYKLAKNENLKRITPPFTKARSQWYRTANPTQYKAIPAGPDAMLFHWNRDALRNWGMSFGGNDLESVLKWTAGIYPQDIDGPAEFRNQETPGDWIVRPDAPPEKVIAELETILNRDLKLNVQLRFAEVDREAYVVKGEYEFQPLPGYPAEDATQFTDRIVRTDVIQVFGAQPAPNSGAGGMGDFNEFCQWLGRWIDAPIVIEATELPKRELSWLLHEPSPSTDSQRALAHDPKLVLPTISAQTGLEFVREKRPIRVLLIEPAD